MELEMQFSAAQLQQVLTDPTPAFLDWLKRM